MNVAQKNTPPHPGSIVVYSDFTSSYISQVYLDISFAFDPEVRLPLVIVPSLSATLPPGEDFGPYPAGAVGGPSYSNFPPPAFPTGSYGAPTAPGAYGYPAPGPTQPGNTASGYNNQ